ncbi:hypothetical protein E2562_007611 [Oryza meyeriana var. granulata]|uniref:Uncharacterized protein n=1 Tax=Oryza meyeriana var. granulata TaxID=110450 RepID=A0A6G1DWP8_9ORYZ|nr:hypothetical protein E2562_007611 [Oryza meyeriana var. granulata]
MGPTLVEPRTHTSAAFDPPTPAAAAPPVGETPVVAADRARWEKCGAEEVVGGRLAARLPLSDFIRQA